MADFKLGRIKFKWRGNWATSTSYLIDDVIKYGGNTYVCIQNHTSPANENLFYTNPGTYTDYWSLQAESLFSKGAYAADTWYKLNDLVKYGARQYRCTTAHTSASAVGGVAIINVGGHTEAEMREKKDRVEDALHATKAAIEEGILPGGGIALLHISNTKLNELINNNTLSRDQQRGVEIVKNSITRPFIQILENAGYSAQQIYGIHAACLARTNRTGYNLSKGTYVDFIEKGIIDPTKVTRCALENAASVAGTMLTTECTIVDKPEKKNQQDDLANMMM